MRWLGWAGSTSDPNPSPNPSPSPNLRALGERLGVLERELRDGLLHGGLLLDELGRGAPARLAQLAWLSSG